MKKKQSENLKNNKALDYVKKNIIVVVIIPIIFIIAIAIILFINNKEVKEYPILYVNNDKLILWHRNGKLELTIDENFNTNKNSELNVQYSNKNSNYFTYLNDGGLYLFNLKESKKTMIAASVEKVYFSKNDKYLIYLDTNNRLYSYDISKNEIYNINDNTEKKIYIQKIYDSLIVYVEDKDNKYTLCTYDLADNKKSILTDDMYNYKISDDKILYGENVSEDELSMYIYNLKTKKHSTLFENISFLLNINDDLSKLAYAKKSTSKLDILDDDELNKDPVTTITRKKLCTYSDYLNDRCTYNQYLDNEYYTVEEVGDKKEVNDSIRDYQKEYKLYDIYINDEKLLTKVMPLYSESNGKFVFYGKIDDSKKVKISTLKSLDDFMNYVDENIKYYYEYNNAKTEIDASDDIIFKNNYYFFKENLYLISNENKLYVINVKNKETKPKLVIENVDNIYIKGDNLFAITDKEDDLYNINLINENNSEKLAYNVKDTRSINNKKYMVLGNCIDGVCDYSEFSNGKLKNIFHDIYDVFPQKGYYYVLKDCYGSSCSLYKETNKKTIIINSNINPDFLAINSINN